jgi:myo-inositol-1(or 4)-monophosphatase
MGIHDARVDDMLRVAVEAVTEAGNTALAIRLTPEFAHEFKPDLSPVTPGDRAAEERIVEIVRAAYPEHRLYGEELGWHNEGGESPYLWVFDPVDGTWSFLNGEPTWCVNLTILRDGHAIAAALYNPNVGEVYSVAEGQPATMNDRPLPVVSWETLEEGVLDFKMARSFRRDIDAILDLWGEKRVGKLTRQDGSPAYCLAKVARGAHTVFVMGCTKRPPDPWDLAAGIMLVRGAGGRVTDLAGNDVDSVRYSRYIVAGANPRLHEQALGLLVEYGVGAR